MTALAEQWSDEVVRTTVNGHPMLMYARRPRRVSTVIEHSRRWQSRPYLIQGERTLTFADHSDLMHRIAGRLASQGVTRADRVMLFAANSPEWVATFFAVLELGAIAVLANGWWSAEEVAHAEAVTRPHLIVTDARHRDRTPSAAAARTVDVDALVADDIEPASAAAGSAVPEDDPAVILFTAGTTRFPKPVVLSHRSLIANLQTLLVVSRKLPTRQGADPRSSVTLVTLPLFHIGAIQLILVPLMTGGQIVFVEGRFDPAAALALIERHRVTMFSAVPTMVERMLATADAATCDLSSLRTIVLGGAPVRDSLLARIAAVVPSAGRGTGRTYGSTEAGGVVSTGVGDDLRDRPDCCGRLAPVVEARVVDPGPDGTGRLLVRSPAVMDRYWDGGPALDDEGWLDTGDIGRVDEEGYLYITGRAKDVIIRGGENISAARVEAVLRSHPAVVDAAVVGLPDQDLGEVVAAWVTVAEAGRVTLGELRRFAEERLARFAVPQYWHLTGERPPVNEAGKVAKPAVAWAWPAVLATPPGRSAAGERTGSRT